MRGDFFFTFFLTVLFIFVHSCVFVFFSRFWLKAAIFPDSAPLVGKKCKKVLLKKKVRTSEQKSESNK